MKRYLPFELSLVPAKYRFLRLRPEAYILLSLLILFLLIFPGTTYRGRVVIDHYYADANLENGKVVFSERRDNANGGIDIVRVRRRNGPMWFPIFEHSMYIVRGAYFDGNRMPQEVIDASIKEIADYFKLNIGTKYLRRAVPTDQYEDLDHPTHLIWWGVIINLSGWCASLTLLWALLWVICLRFREKRAREMELVIQAGFCPKCKYNIQHLPQKRCPECGETWE